MRRQWILLALVAVLTAVIVGGFLSQSEGTPPGPPSQHCPDLHAQAPPRPHTRLTIGLNSVWNNDCNLAAVAGAGVTIERLEIDWSDVEPRPGAWTWRKEDPEVGAAARHGLAVLPVLIGVPRWAGPAWDAIPANPARYAAYVAHVVARYGPHGSFWREHRGLPAHPARWFELWNEPYGSGFSFGGPKPAAYARLVRASTLAGRRADPAARFLIEAELSSTAADNSRAPWIAPMFAAVPGLRRYFDGVAVHPYTSPKSPASYDRAHPDDSFRRIEQIRAQFAAHGAGGVPFWITEVGWSTCPADPIGCVSDSTQASYLAQVFQIVKSRYSSWVKAVFPYNYRDGQEAGGTDREAWFGLIRRAGQPKQAWSVLRSAARAG